MPRKKIIAHDYYGLCRDPLEEEDDRRRKKDRFAREYGEFDPNEQQADRELGSESGSTEPDELEYDPGGDLTAVE